MKDNHFREYYFLDNDVILIRDSYNDGDPYCWLEHPATVEIYQAVTDHLGSIIAVYDKSQRKVYEASYDAWGRQTVTHDEIELYRGYTGHENIGRTELVHMDGRMYDSSTGRFLSPDNYVQLPENSQSFNRYSYCINNPLKYTDPTGQFFQIGFIGASLLAADAFANAMTTDSGSKFFVSSAISIFSPAVAGAIGGMFGHSVGSFGNELLRAGAHGLASGVANALTGENFGAGFASGAFASFAGSGAQWAGLGKGGVLGATTLFGGIGSAAFGGDFLAGAMTGLNIGLYNHCFHYDAEVNLPEVVVTGKAKSNLGVAIASMAMVCVADDVSGVGVIDDVAIPVIAAAGGAYWTYEHRADIEKCITRAYNSISTMATKTMECRPGYVYHLVATTDGMYPNVRGGNVHLNAGDTWKIGETVNGQARYGQAWLDAHGLKMKQASGWMTNKYQLWIEEKRQLIEYASKYRGLPPGNKLFK